MERRRQEKVTLGGSLGTSFSRRCGAGLEKVKDKRRASLKVRWNNIVKLMKQIRCYISIVKVKVLMNRSRILAHKVKRLFIEHW